MSTSSFYPIIGLPVVDKSNVPQRIECDTWSTNPNNDIQVSLFIRAMQLFYDEKNTERTSFFQIAGIHGLPAMAWDGVQPPADLHGGSSSDWGYCAHGKISFPTWHRPYMLLFEQCVNHYMHAAIDSLSFPITAEKDQWKQAADQWRLPYWDWGLKKTDVGVPNLFTKQSIQIRAPLSATHAISWTTINNNPLWLYQFRDTNGASTNMQKLGVHASPWDQTSATNRHGLFATQQSANTWTIQSGATGANNFNATSQSLNDHSWRNPFSKKWNPTQSSDVAATIGAANKATPISDLVYRLFTDGYFSTWAQFATTTITGQSNWKQMYSIENIHNSLHVFIGGGDGSKGMGHMCDPTVAAFDPIFFMHHCNIDRQFAIFQTLHPQIWLDSVSAGQDLAPFHKQDGTLYKGTDTRDWTALGYEYDILAPRAGETKSTQAYLDRVKKGLDDYYNTGVALLTAKPDVVSPLASVAPTARMASSTFTSHAAQPIAGDQPVVVGPEGINGDALVQEAAPAPPMQAEPAAHVYPDYLINVIYDRYALGGAPYTIHFFLDSVHDNDIQSREHSISKHPYHLGSVSTFSSNMIEFCHNCRSQADQGLLSSAQLPITMPLLSHATDENCHGISNIHPRSVEPYLSQYLHWKVVSASGELVDPVRIPRTRVFVVSGSAKHHREPERLSEYLDYHPMPAATQGKALGASAEHYNDVTHGIRSQ